MSAMGTLGRLDVTVTADTKQAQAEIKAVGTVSDATALKMKAAARVAEMVGASTNASAAKSATAMAVQARAAERARSAWAREQIQQERATAAQAEAARIAEMAALKQDILTRSLAKQSGVLSGLRDRLALTTKGVQLSARDWIGAFGPLGELLGVGLFAGMGISQINKLAALNNELSHLRDETGLTVTSLSGLQVIVKGMGAEWDPVANGLVRLNHALAEAPFEATYARALKEIGISLDEMNPATTTAEQRLQTLSTAFQNHAGTVAAADAAIELFGRGGKALIPVLVQQGSALQANMTKMGALTGVTDKSADAAQRWTRDWTQLGVDFRAALMPVMNYADNFLHGILGFVKTIEAVFLSVAAGLVGTGDMVGNVVKSIAKEMLDLHNLDFGGAIDDAHAAAQRITDDWKEMGGIAAKSWKDAWHETWDITPLPPAAKAGADVDTSDDGSGTGGGGSSSNAGAYQRAVASQSHWLKAKSVIAEWQEHPEKYWDSLHKGPSKDEQELGRMQEVGAGMDRRTAEDVNRSGERWKPYNEALARAAEIQAQLAAQAGRTRIAIGLETGALSKQQAAAQTAALHLKEYLEQKRALEAQKARLEGDASLTAAQRETGTLQVQNQLDELSGRYAIQSQLDDEQLRATENLHEFGDGLARTAQELTEWGAKLSQLFVRTLDSTNDQILNAMTGKRTNFSEVGSQFFRGVGKMGLENLEGRAMGMLGIHGGAKPDGSRGNPFYVVDASKGGGGQSGPSGFAKTVQGWWSKLFGGGGGDAGGASMTSTGGSMVSGLGSALGGLLGLFGMGGGAAAAGAGAAGGLGSALAGLARFADGGEIPSGLPAIVGERGPELFLPSSSGRIVPNHQISMGGGHTFHNEIHVDARGATDPAAVHEAAHRAVTAAAPQIVEQSVARMRDYTARHVQRGMLG